MNFLRVLCLPLVLGCVIVCEGKPKLRDKHSKTLDDLSDKHPIQPAIQFPTYEEMTSAEREANKVMARKIAKIVEKNLHMIADDVLQVLSIVKTDGPQDPEDELDDLEPKDNNLNEQDLKDFEQM